jgi:glycerol-3-phosphate dehydrogenase
MTAELARDPRAAAAADWDLIVVGGGVHGAMLALEAARRGLAALLVERDDFGGATSWNSLRIVHGGLRYLQSLDLPRFRESIAERRWLLRSFPDVVEPLPCLMPLYRTPRGGSLRRPAVMRLALAANDLLSRSRNDGVREDREIPPGRLLGAAETAQLFPGVDRVGLAGGALWHDARLTESPRLIVEVLRWAALCGSRALNYTEAVELRQEAGRVTGLRAIDRISGESLELRGRAVVNCAGPWARALAGRFDRDRAELFRPVLAFNLLLNRTPPSRAAIAVAAPGPGEQTWFLVPFQGRTLAGTFYVPANGMETGPDTSAVDAFLASLNAAVPGWGLSRRDVVRPLWGSLPASAEGSAEPASRPVLHDHGAHGGPAGLLSVSGVKLTTARAVAERALAAVLRRPLPPPGPIERPPADPPLPLRELLILAQRDPRAVRAHLRRMAEREAVVTPEDLLLRRTDWGLRPEAAEAARLCADMLGDEAPPARRAAAGKAGP